MWRWCSASSIFTRSIYWPVALFRRFVSLWDEILKKIAHIFFTFFLYHKMIYHFTVFMVLLLRALSFFVLFPISYCSYIFRFISVVFLFFGVVFSRIGTSWCWVEIRAISLVDQLFWRRRHLSATVQYNSSTKINLVHFRVDEEKIFRPFKNHQERTHENHPGEFRNQIRI